jgi:rubredoxin
MQSPSKIEKPVFGSIGKTFRGEIWENCQRFKLIGKAYEAMPKEQDGHFQIRSAHHLKGPLRGLKDAGVRVVVVVGATQVLKSILGDIYVPYAMEHIMRNMIVYFEDDPKAKLFCGARLMNTIQKHPVLSAMISQIDADDNTKTKIKFPGDVTLQVCGLNDGNTSSLSWPLIWVSEAWQHKKDGLLAKAKKRADRFPNDCKILIESQAGFAGEDLHTEAKSAHQVPLTWLCPECQGRQTWEFSQRRPGDFVPRERLKVNCVTIGGETAFVSQLPKPGSFAGMTFAPEGSIDERARSSVWECYHCGHHIQDKPDIRQQLMDSYEQDYQIPGPNGSIISPASVCFYLPKESARDNKFEDSTKSYLQAKDAEQAGNLVPLQNWYMSERAVFYEPKLTQPQIVVATGSYDPNKIIANEHHRGLIVDCQKHLTLDTVGTFWYEAYVADTSGNSFQIERGFATSWEEWIAVQHKWKIPNHYVCVDGRKWTPEILKQAAAHAELVTGKLFGRESTYWSAWKILLGDAPARHYRWPDGQYRVWSPPTPRPEYFINARGEKQRVIVMMYRWSNLSIKDQLQNLRIGGEGYPKFVALPRNELPEKTQLKEVGDLTYENQMDAEMRGEKDGKPNWVKIGNRPNHYRDIACMRLVRMAMDSLAGHIAAQEEK